MSTDASRSLTFEGRELSIINRDGQQWLGIPQIGGALGYKNPESAVSNIYNAHADEFTDSMTQLVELETAGGRQQVRIFTLRGAHLIAMFSRTKVAKQFRVWVLDRLEEEQLNWELEHGCEPVTAAELITEEVQQAKYRAINELVEQLHLDGNPVLVPYIELANITRQLRGIETAAQLLSEFSENADRFIGDMKVVTGQSMLEDER